MLIYFRVSFEISFHFNVDPFSNNLNPLEKYDGFEFLVKIRY